MKTKDSTTISLSAKIKTLFFSSRPVSWINTAYPFAAAYLATNGKMNVFFVLAAFYFLIPYNVLIYVVNDVFDYESDIKNPRKNSIEGGLLPPSLHRFMLAATGVITLIFALPVLIFADNNARLFLLLILMGAAAYSAPPLRTKERPFADSITSSFHFVSPMIFAFLVTGWRMEYIGYTLAFFFWGCASHMFGAVQDIVSDREANIASIATYLGAKKTVRLSLALYITAGIFVALYGWPQVIVGAMVTLYCLAVFPFRNVSDKKSNTANKGWRQFMLINQLLGAAITMLLLYPVLFR